MAAAMVETMELLKIAGIEPVATGPIPPRLLPHAIGAPDFIFRNFLLRVQKIDPHARSSMSEDRKSVVSGKSVSVRFDLGGRRLLKKKKLLHNLTSTPRT